MALSILSLSKHQYYYEQTGHRPGKQPSQTTLKLEDQQVITVSNQVVVEEIKNTQLDPDTDYGYRKMSTLLMIAGYYINHKKVYRLMKEAGLLKPQHKKRDKTYVKYRIVIPEGPLEVLEMDIKYVWVTKDRRYAYILTVIDTFTRFVLHRQVGFTMKSRQVKQAWEKVITNYLQPADLLRKQIHIEIRNDNGPQFGSKIIRKFFEENHLNQVFTHPYTPQENGHIESFHSILSRALGDGVFWDMEELMARLTIFYEKYNNVRLHGSIANLSPSVFWDLWQEGNITRRVLKNKKVKFNLNIPYQQLSGNMNMREVPCSHSKPLDGVENEHKNEMFGAESFLQPSV
jgi:transposase InsO family protein